MRAPKWIFRRPRRARLRTRSMPTGCSRPRKRAAFRFEPMDEDLASRSREQLIDEVRRLRAGIRAHRDSSGHDLCWHHPQLWELLPEVIPVEIAVPAWPQFLRGCIKYRQSLDRDLPDAQRTDTEAP